MSNEDWGFNDPFRPRPSKSERELYCERVNKVCKQIRDKYKRQEKDNNNYLSITKEREEETLALCEKHKVNPNLIFSILFGRMIGQQIKIEL